MKRIVLSILLLYHLSLFAQEERYKYERAVDYVACVCINDTNGVEKKDCENGEVFQESDLSNYPATKSLFQAFQKLKDKSMPEDIVGFLSDEIFSNRKYQAINDFAKKPDRQERIVNIKSSIRENLEEKIVTTDTDLNDGEKIEEDGTISLATTFEAPNSERSKGSFFAVNFWTILAVFLLAVVFFFLNGRIGNVNHRMKKAEDKLKSLLFVQQSNPQNVNVNPRLEEQFKKIKERMDRLESEINTKESKTTEEKPYEVILKVNDETKPKTAEQAVFYMATPSADKEFHIRSKSETFRPTQSLYRFFVDKSGEKAEFEFHSDDSGIKESTNSPHVYIEPICEPQNAHNPNAKKIVTTEKGRAEKKDDKWIVTKKAKIRYE